MPKNFRWFGWGLAVLVIFGCSGCALLFEGHQGPEVHRGTSLVQYLYPDKARPKAKQGIPHLELPLRVGIAFVPDDGITSLAEGQKVALLNSVVANFQQHPVIGQIEVIPSAYLQRRGGFTNLDQLRQLYDIDAIALISYDQVQHVDPTLFSLTYWTIIGAYLVPGDMNDTSTMIDAAVFHIPSRQLLFRAPGTSRVEGMSAVAYQQSQLREDAERGFAEASVALVPELQKQLALFQERVKKQPKKYRVSYRPGYSGGALDGSLLVPVLVLGVIALRRSA